MDSISCKQAQQEGSYGMWSGVPFFPPFEIQNVAIILNNIYVYTKLVVNTESKSCTFEKAYIKYHKYVLVKRKSRSIYY